MATPTNLRACSTTTVRSSFIWVELPPGEAIRLHKHAYKEIFVIQEGTATFTVGNEVLEGRAGQIIIVPAGVPHKFANTGGVTLRQVDLHVSAYISTQWLENDFERQKSLLNGGVIEGIFG